MLLRNNFQVTKEGQFDTYIPPKYVITYSSFPKSYYLEPANFLAYILFIIELYWRASEFKAILPRLRDLH